MIAPRSPLPQFTSTESSSSLSLPFARTEGNSFGASGRSPSFNRRSPQKRGSPLPIDFKFPQAPPSPGENTSSVSAVSSSSRIAEEELVTETPSTPPTKDHSTDTPELSVQLAPATKIQSTSLVDGSTRSSGEFYSLSNNSTETLASEYVMSPKNHSRPPLRHRRHYSNMDSRVGSQFQPFQRLLMGYAQISASFTIDGSLVNQSVFEEVKRKGVVGQVDASAKAQKPRQGFWGNLGLTNISESFSGFMSGGELNGLREMRGVSSSQSVPLLSTPQSLLFVDLQLDPHEEKSFSFSFTLPKGLPASHKGKAIKISYNLVIGTQLASNPKDVQRVHRINIPFRVLSGVDGEYH